MDRARYPTDWEGIAFFIKDACGWVCQNPACNKQCRKPGERHKSHRYTLTVAHLYPDDHAPDAPVVFVAALCAPCHLKEDAIRRARQRQAAIMELAKKLSNQPRFHGKGFT